MAIELQIVQFIPMDATLIHKLNLEIILSLIFFKDQTAQSSDQLLVLVVFTSGTFYLYWNGPPNYLLGGVIAWLYQLQRIRTMNVIESTGFFGNLGWAQKSGLRWRRPVGVAQHVSFLSWKKCLFLVDSTGIFEHSTWYIPIFMDNIRYPMTSLKYLLFGPLIFNINMCSFFANFGFNLHLTVPGLRWAITQLIFYFELGLLFMSVLHFIYILYQSNIKAIN